MVLADMVVTVVWVAHFLSVVLACTILVAVGSETGLRLRLLAVLVFESFCFVEGVGGFGGRVVEDVVDVIAVTVYIFTHFPLFIKIILLILIAQRNSRKFQTTTGNPLLQRQLMKDQSSS